MKEILAFIEDNKDHSLVELFDFLRIKSISTAEENKQDVRDCAEFLKKHLIDIGLSNTEILETKGHPIVYSEYIQSKELPTVLIYGHYDVQPPDPYELWVSDPFQPEIRGEHIFARGISDDKGQLFCHVKAIESMLKCKGALPVNIKLLFEGEEEIGSEHLPEFIEENKEKLSADVAVISDTPMVNRDQPALCFSVRGMIYCELELTGPNKDLHSGQYGGFVQNPIQALAQMITRLKDENDVVQIPGFYDDVEGPSSLEKESLNKLISEENKILEQLDCEVFVGDETKSVAEKKCVYPTFDCNGIYGGYTDPGAKTIIPSKATAKMSMRLTAKQDPYKILESFKAYLKEITPPGIKSKLTVMNIANPAKMDTESLFMKAAYDAFSSVHKNPPLFIGEGGTIPVVADFQHILGIDTVMMGFNCPDDDIHSPNERMLVDGFMNGIKTSAYFLNALGKR
ncbi:dipeptidase [Candidatus Marinamargulisbacteria bacterium SCGC AG-343-D04]|nr:dipeptidase [Candidatus Marinamargulisbacteria bacterium SCGC AG-343-D04]